MRPLTAAQAYEWANATPPKAYWATTSSGSIELAITLEDAQSCSHSGPCDLDVEQLLRVPYIAEQLGHISSDTLAAELKEYGAWDAEELEDHQQNLARLLWLECGHIAEENID